MIEPSSYPLHAHSKLGVHAGIIKWFAGQRQVHTYYKGSYPGLSRRSLNELITQSTNRISESSSLNGQAAGIAEIAVTQNNTGAQLKTTATIAHKLIPKNT